MCQKVLFTKDTSQARGTNTKEALQFLTASRKLYIVPGRKSRTKQSKGLSFTINVSCLEQCASTTLVVMGREVVDEDDDDDVLMMRGGEMVNLTSGEEGNEGEEESEEIVSEEEEEEESEAATAATAAELSRRLPPLLRPTLLPLLPLLLPNCCSSTNCTTKRCFVQYICACRNLETLRSSGKPQPAPEK